MALTILVSVTLFLWEVDKQGNNNEDESEIYSEFFVVLNICRKQGKKQSYLNIAVKNKIG